MKKIAAVFCIVAFAGCATLTKLCPDQAQADKLRADIGALLKISQQGYEEIMAIAGRTPDPRVAVAAKALDGALMALGSFYFDKVCPTLKELEQAAYEAEMAAQAKQEIIKQ